MANFDGDLYIENATLSGVVEVRQPGGYELCEIMLPNVKIATGVRTPEMSGDSITHAPALAPRPFVDVTVLPKPITGELFFLKSDRQDPEYMNRSELLETAGKIINGDRQEAYGSAQESFQRIADYWSVFLKGRGATLEERPLQPFEVALMLDLMKTSRTQTSPDRRDNWVDKIGYAALGGEVS